MIHAHISLVNIEFPEFFEARNKTWTENDVAFFFVSFEYRLQQFNLVE